MIPLVLLSGFMGCASDWDAFLAELGGPATILPSFSAPLPQNQPFVLGGYSMGGRVAIARSLAAGCRGVVSISSSPGLRDPAERQNRLISDEEWAKRLENLAGEADFRAFLQDWWSQPVFAESTLSLADRDRLITSRLQLDPIKLAADLRAFGPAAMPSRWDYWNALVLPKLAIAGEKDPKYVRLAEQMGDHQIIPGSGHQIPLEQPRLLAQTVARFIDQVRKLALI